MKFIALAIVSLFLCSCATNMSNSETSVIIDSSPSGKKFTIKNSKGKVVHEGVTPETVMLHNSAGFFEPEVHSISVDGKSSQVIGKMTLFYWGNFFNIIGFVADPITGAMWNLPDEVTIKDGKAMTKYSKDTLE